MFGSKVECKGSSGREGLLLVTVFLVSFGVKGGHSSLRVWVRPEADGAKPPQMQFLLLVFTRSAQ